MAVKHWLKLNEARAKIHELGRAGKGGSKAFAKAVKEYEKLQARCLEDVPQLAANGLAKEHPGGVAEEEAAKAARLRVDEHLAKMVPARSQEERAALAESLTEQTLARGKRVGGRYEFVARKI